MRKYSIDKLIHGYGDHDFESKYQGSATVMLLEKIANELAEANEIYTMSVKCPKCKSTFTQIIERLEKEKYLCNKCQEVFVK